MPFRPIVQLFICLMLLTGWLYTPGCTKNYTLDPLTPPTATPTPITNPKPSPTPSGSPIPSPTPTCANSPNMGSSWVETTASAPFGQRTYYSSAVFDPATGNPSGRMWMIAGQNSTSYTSNDVWSSPDGATWTEVTANAAFVPRNGQASLVFDPATGTTTKKLWVIGGEYASGFYSDVWSSPDGVTWTQTTPNAGFAGRYGFGCAAFNGKMYVIAGYNGSPACNNDVWSSPDGVTWTQVTASAPFSKRECCVATVFNGRLWLIGGFSGSGTYLDDVWYTSDGITWTQATANAAFSARYNFGLTVADNQMWVVGGVASNVCQYDVWNSSDGITWTQASASTGFAARAQFNALTFSNGGCPSLWIIGGWNFGGALADIWHSP